jgi:hypothetical protein
MSIYKKSKVFHDTNLLQKLSYFYFTRLFRDIQKQIDDDEVKKQNRLISQLTMWHDFTPSNSKRYTNTAKFTTTISHKRTKKN